MELQRVGILQQDTSSTPRSPVLPHATLMTAQASRKRPAQYMADANGDVDSDVELSSALLRAVEAAEGFSGRALRKLPFQAHALFVQVSYCRCSR